MRRQRVVSSGAEFYGVKGCSGARPLGMVSFSPPWKVAAVPRTVSSAVPDRVVAPLECRLESWRRPTKSQWRPIRLRFDHQSCFGHPSSFDQFLVPCLGRGPTLGFGHQPSGLGHKPPTSAGPQTSNRPSAPVEPLSTVSTAPIAYERVILSNPRILILTCQQTKLSSLSPFQRRDDCDLFGKATRCDRLRDGSIEVEFSSGAEAA